MNKAKSGGIIGNKVRNVGMRNGKPARGVSPQAASRIGIQTISSTGVAKVPGPNAKPLGNELAKNVGKGGPGAGRTVRRAGSQQPTPAATSTTTPGGWPWEKQ
jgi:hypothetical protein